MDYNGVIRKLEVNADEMRKGNVSPTGFGIVGLLEEARVCIKETTEHAQRMDDLCDKMKEEYSELRRDSDELNDEVERLREQVNLYEKMLHKLLDE